MALSKEENRRTVSVNRRARFDYHIEDTIEAGLVLTGTEVKSVMQGKALIAEAYASCEGNELWLINSHVPEYEQANRFNHEPRRRRKLLVHRAQLRKLSASVAREGMTLVPLRMYFNDRGRLKIEIGLAKGKKSHDKREATKNRDWDRQKQRLMRQNG
jgi:SsrA-binding protein